MAGCLPYVLCLGQHCHGVRCLLPGGAHLLLPGIRAHRHLHRHPLRQYLSDPSARGFHRARDVLGVEPSSHKGEVVGILAICGSVVTNILFLTVAVVAGSTLLAFLPESVTSAMANYILPSLFGACFASMAVKKLKIALYALPMAIILRLLGVPAWITIVCCIFGTILITYFLYKKKLIK